MHMNNDKYVFAQLVEFLNNDKFRRVVTKYGGDHYVKHFTCWNQLLVMMFGQLTNRGSVRDLIVIIEAHRSKCYHLGFGKHVTKSNLAKANQNRDCRIFEEFAYFLVAEARSRRITDIFKLGGSVYAFDSTTIDLCLSVFWWAKFRKHKGGIKIHTLYDIETQVPAFFHITKAAVNDVRAMDELTYELGTPKTNGMVERVNLTIKTATIHKTSYDSYDCLEKHLMEFLVFYNTNRRHGFLVKELKVKTPLDA